MPRNPPAAPSKSGSGPLPPWLIIVLFLAVLGISWWQTSSTPSDKSRTETVGRDGSPSQSSKSAKTHDTEPSDSPIPVEVATESASREQTASEPSHTRLKNQTIRDLEGRVVFQGTIDLQPTLDRIANGKTSHGHDGTTFQNREHRLPARQSGYYKEFVHPTPKLSGPGPQRVIVGKDGDVRYTPNHYKTFVRIE